MAERDPEGQISVEQRDKILLMGIDRPEKRNGLTPQMWEQLRDAYTRLDQEEDLHVGILFGHGEHFCPGASLARAEACVSFERLLARFDDLQLVDPGALSYVPSFLIRGLEALPLRFRRSA